MRQYRRNFDSYTYLVQ